MDQSIKIKDTQSYRVALPYLSLLPLNQQCLDTTVFNKIEDDFAYQILEYLLEDRREDELWIRLGKADKKDKEKVGLINALQDSLQAFDEQKAGLSLGYPMVVVLDEQLNKPVAAPLFIWEVVLQQSVDNSNDLKVDLLNTNGKVNGILRSYLTTKLGLDWESEIGLVNDISADLVVEVCEKIGLALEIEGEEDANSFIERLEIAPCPNPYAALRTGILPNLLLVW